MVPWWALLVAASVGTTAGLLVMAALAAGARADEERRRGLEAHRRLVSGPLTEAAIFEPVADTPISDLIGDLGQGPPE